VPQNTVIWYRCKSWVTRGRFGLPFGRSASVTRPVQQLQACAGKKQAYGCFECPHGLTCRPGGVDRGLTCRRAGERGRSLTAPVDVSTSTDQSVSLMNKSTSTTDCRTSLTHTQLYQHLRRLHKLRQVLLLFPPLTLRA